MSRSSAVVPQIAARLALPGQWTPVGWIAPDGIDYDGWCAIGEALATMTTGVHWWLGDYFVYGEHNYGEKYAQMMDETKFGYSTLSRDRWVAASVDFCRRVQKLTFSHHEAVAKLSPEEQERWLSRAVVGDGVKRWSVKRLKEEIKAAKSPNRDNGNRATEPEPPQEVRIEQLEQDKERLERETVELRQVVTRAAETVRDKGYCEDAFDALVDVAENDDPPAPMLAQHTCPECGHSWVE